MSGLILFLCGCNKQAKINSQKIDDLSRRITLLEQNQARQMQILQTELNELAPELNKVNSTYFEKDRDAALFFHTNTLYLLLTIGKQIETRPASSPTRNAKPRTPWNTPTTPMNWPRFTSAPRNSPKP